MIRCSNCGYEKDEDEFAFKNKATGRRSTICKGCKREYNKKYYSENKDDYRKSSSRNKKKYRKEVRDFIWSYLSVNPCVDCGESDPIVLDFDHLRDKEFCVSTYANSTMSLNRVKKEVEKCEIRCSNCHRRKTARERGWWTDKMGG